MTTTTPASADSERNTGALNLVDVEVTVSAASGDDGSLDPHPESESNPPETLLRRVGLMSVDNSVVSLDASLSSTQDE